MKPTKRQWIFQAWIGGGAQESCRPALEGGWISVPNWERGACDQAEMITKRPLGLTFCHSLPGELAQCVVSQDTAASSGSSEEEDTAGWMVCGSLSSPTLFPALPLLLCPASVLPQGHYPFTTDLLAAPFCEEVVLVTSAAAIYKDFTAPGLGTVEVPHLLLMTGTWECWVQADARPRRCWNGRGNGSIMRWS